MTENIKKIHSIKKMAVFQNFNWDTTIRDSGNNIVEFKKINIFYGRNYSGKTTLSRIFRAIETGVISDKYENPEFSVAINNGNNITQSTLTGHGQTVRVFNEDFVKENLRFIVDDEHSINSFAILGDDNNKIEEDIKAHEHELGFEGDATGLYGKLNEAISTFKSAKTYFEKANSSLEDKLKDKANKAGTGIKHNKLFGDANYNITKIKSDITTVTDESYIPLNNERRDELNGLLKEEAKPTIPVTPEFNLKFQLFSEKAKGLVQKKISVSEPIQELLDDAVLQDWVRSGRKHHESKRTTCGFCGSPLPKELWDKLDKHFNQESENLRSEIDQLLRQIESEKNRMTTLITFNANAFYSSFSGEIEGLKINFESAVKKYGQALQSLEEILNKRMGDIFRPIGFFDTKDFSVELDDIRTKYEDLRNQSNKFTNSLSSKQSESRAALRLHEVYTFIINIKYSDECVTIENLKHKFEMAQEARDSAQRLVDEKKLKIAALKAQLKDESKGAERVNELLNNFFGHQSLSLKAIENVDEEKNKSGYRFEITRNEKKAYHLSEGECSLIAFCYFMAKLEDVKTRGNRPIIWIDDPISSLDANHIFFVYSLINSEIVKPEKFKQLFVSTHNLDFLKYLKRLPGGMNKNSSQYFIVQGTGKNSHIQLMPSYLKDYVTEFNYLFHQIYKCAKADVISNDNHECYYNFGNNARKFLEAFLYYKYPNAKDKDDKLTRFFGDDALASSLTDRVNNEYSHLAGVFERSIMPVDVPEMKTAAEFILRKIKEKDIDQYNALLHSIGEAPDSNDGEAESMTFSGGA